MKLFAISDLHLGYEHNREALLQMAYHPDDWLLMAGDICESRSHLKFAIVELGRRFKQLVWTPGNHELWTLPNSGEPARGQFKYEQMVNLCREYGVLTPEDPYPIVTFGTQTVRICPLFLLYDYSFRPANVSIDDAIAWALESGVHCTDEHLLYPDPFENVIAWCHSRCKNAEERLKICADGISTILVNHFPLREDLVWLPRIPRFSIWCGTQLTEDWHIRFNAIVAVSGHLHIPSTRSRDGTRFEEVSLGYPNQWSRYSTINECVREILPAFNVPRFPAKYSPSLK